MIARIALALLLSTLSPWAIADCVEGAKNKTKFSRVNSHTIALTGGYDGAIVIRTPCRVKRNSSIEILKDSFCNEEEAVLVIDGKECAAETVSRDDKFNEDKLYDDYNWDYEIN